MKRLITTQILLDELGKYGTLTISDGQMKYTIWDEYVNNAVFLSIQQDNKSLRMFLNTCALCFENGFNPLFDVITNR